MSNILLPFVNIKLNSSYLHLCSTYFLLHYNVYSHSNNTSKMYTVTKFITKFRLSNVTQMFKIVSKVENKFTHFLVKQCFEGTKLSREMGRNVFIADVCNYLFTSKSDGSDLNIFVLLLVFQQRSRI